MPSLLCCDTSSALLIESCPAASSKEQGFSLHSVFQGAASGRSDLKVLCVDYACSLSCQCTMYLAQFAADISYAPLRYSVRSMKTHSLRLTSELT